MTGMLARVIGRRIFAAHAPERLDCSFILLYCLEDQWILNELRRVLKT